MARDGRCEALASSRTHFYRGSGRRWMQHDAHDEHDEHGEEYSDRVWVCREVVDGPASLCGVDEASLLGIWVRGGDARVGGMERKNAGKQRDERWRREEQTDKETQERRKDRLARG